MKRKGINAAAWFYAQSFNGRIEPSRACQQDEAPVSYNECLYCGEPIEAPALYCCEEHEEGRRME